MVSEKEFNEILEKKGLVEDCRNIWWKHLGNIGSHIKPNLAAVKNCWKDW